MPIWNPAVTSIPLRDEADLAAIEKTPFDAITTLNSSYDVLEAQAKDRPGAAAIVYMPTADPEAPVVTLTFGELFAKVTQAANLFHTLADGQPVVVAMLLPAVPQAHVALWGAAAAGVAAPLNFLLGEGEIVALLRAMKATVLLALGPHPALDVWRKAEAVRARVPTLRALVQLQTGPDVPVGVHAFDRALGAQPADRLKREGRPARGDVAAYFHTGGTTGLPKLARHTHRNHLAMAFGVGHAWAFEAGEAVMNGLPIFHVGGALDAGLAPLAAGASFLLMTPAGLRNPEVVKNIWRIIDRRGLNAVGGVPTSIAAMLQVPLDGADISRVKLALTGGSPLSLDHARAFEERFDMKLCEVYGMTETSGNAAITPRHGRRVPGSVGLRAPYVEVKAARLDESGCIGADCAPGESGVLLLRGPTVMPGYTDERLDAGVLLEGGWLVTGDLGKVTADARVFITGRAKDLIIRGGHNIDPAVIEAAIEGHPAVMMSAAVGMPDEYAGELPALFVKLKPGAAATPEELTSWVAERISERAAVPKAVRTIAEMPLTPVGKIFKPALRAMLIEDVLADRLRRAPALAGVTCEVTARFEPSGLVATIVLFGPRQGEEAARQAAAEAVSAFTVARVIEHRGAR